MDNILRIELSLVIPIYNEEESIPLLQYEIEKFSKLFSPLQEIVFVDDGSTDQTLILLKKWAEEEKKIRIIQFKKNEGHQRALIEGLRSSRGKYIVTMDADLQDPVDLIPSMFSKAQEGFEIVHTQRTLREGESFFRKTATWFFYRIAQKLCRKPIFLDVGDFRLMTSKAMTSYFSTFKNPSILRKEIPTLSERQVVLTYKRLPRLHGKSKFTFLKLVKFAMEILKN